jgi:hypothetical protein
MVEVGPQHIGEIELGVRERPPQEVADPLFAAGADERIGRRQIREREPLPTISAVITPASSSPAATACASPRQASAMPRRPP